MHLAITPSLPFFFYIASFFFRRLFVRVVPRGSRFVGRVRLVVLFPLLSCRFSFCSVYYFVVVVCLFFTFCLTVVLYMARCEIDGARTQMH